MNLTPLIFDHHKNILLLVEEDLKQNQTVILLKEAGPKQNFLCHNKTDLIVINAWNDGQLEPTVIIYSRFYKDFSMQENTLASSLNFLNYKLLLQSQISNIQAAFQRCIDFSKISISEISQLSLESSNRSKREAKTNDTHSNTIVNYQKKLKVIAIEVKLSSLMYGALSATLEEICNKYSPLSPYTRFLLHYGMKPLLIVYSLGFEEKFKLLLYLIMNFFIEKITEPLLKKYLGEISNKIILFLLPVFLYSFINFSQVFREEEDKLVKCVEIIGNTLVNSLVFRVGEWGMKKVINEYQFFKKEEKSYEEREERKWGVKEIKKPGNVLLSRGGSPKVSSAQNRFTAEFEMGSGGSGPLRSPGILCPIAKAIGSSYNKLSEQTSNL